MDLEYLIACDIDTRKLAACEHIRRWRLNNAITVSATHILRADRRAQSDKCGPAQAVYIATRDALKIAQAEWDAAALRDEVSGPAPCWPHLALVATSTGERLDYTHTTCTGNTQLRVDATGRTHEAILRGVDAGPLLMREPRDVLMRLILVAFGVCHDHDRQALRISHWPHTASVQAMRILIFMATRGESADLAKCARILWPSEQDALVWDAIEHHRSTYPATQIVAHRTTWGAEREVIMYFTDGVTAWQPPSVVIPWREDMRTIHQQGHGVRTIGAGMPREQMHALAMDDWSEDDLERDESGQIITHERPAHMLKWTDIITGIERT